MSLNIFAMRNVMTGPARSVRGFTMIEVLVTLVIMMFGLLGLAGLILKGQKAGFEAYQRNQALIIATDIAEKMKTNRLPLASITPLALNSDPYIAGGVLVGAGPLTVPAVCLGGTCTGQTLVDFDIATWNNLLLGSSETSLITGGNVGGIINARGCIQRAGAVGTPVTISVAWQGDMDTVVPAGSNCGAGLYGTATRRRLVTINIL